MIERSLFNADHDAFRDSFRRFVDKEIAPFHAEWEDTQPELITAMREAGANGFLSKPIQIEELEQALLDAQRDAAAAPS